MRGSQILALVAGIVLLLPGLCFLGGGGLGLYAVATTADRVGPEALGMVVAFLLIGVLLLAGVFALLRHAVCLDPPLYRQDRRFPPTDG